MRRTLLELTLAAAVGAAITAACVLSGLDWAWAVFCNRHPPLVWAAVPGVALGMVVPLALPAWLLLRHRSGGRPDDALAARRALTAMGAAYLVMTALKVVTNRVDMEPFEPIGDVDTSGRFRFGWLNSDSWWESLSEGWPSGHTMIAVAMAVALHPHLSGPARRVHTAWALYVALSVSTAFHWVSDVLVGALLGVAIGEATLRHVPAQG